MELQEVEKLAVQCVGDWRHRLIYKPQDVDCDSEPKEVVHLEQKSEGASLALKENSVQLDELIQSCKSVVDEQQPVDEGVRRQSLSSSRNCDERTFMYKIAELPFYVDNCITFNLFQL